MNVIHVYAIGGLSTFDKIYVLRMEAAKSAGLQLGMLMSGQSIAMAKMNTMMVGGRCGGTHNGDCTCSQIGMLNLINRDGASVECPPTFYSALLSPSIVPQHPLRGLWSACDF